MTHHRSAFGAPPQGGATGGPAKPDPRWPLDCGGSCAGGRASAPRVAGTRQSSRLRACIGLALTAAVASLHAQAITDPTRPPTLAVAASATASARPASAAPAPARSPRLQSVQLPREGHASALVDGRLVFVGDRLGSATVAVIDAQGLELRDANGKAGRLRLIDAAIVKQSISSANSSPAPLAHWDHREQP